MRLIILMLVFAIVPLFSAKAQELTVYSGIAQTSMSDLKYLQILVQRQSPVSLKSTQSFPAFWNYGAKMNWLVEEKISIGFRAFTTSTGARSAYQDYSGKIVDDYALRCYGLMSNFEYTFLKKNKLEVRGYAGLGMALTYFNWHTDYEIGSTIQIEDDNYKSTNKVGELGFQVRQSYKKFFLEETVGVLLNIAGDLINTRDGSKINMGHDAKADWSGARISLGLGYDFYKPDN